MTDSSLTLPPDLDPRGPGGTPPTSPPPDVGGPPSRARRIVKAFAIGTAAVVLLASGGLYAAYRHFDGNITRLQGVLSAGGTRQEGAQNFLLVGSDSRAGAGNQSFQANKGQEQVAGQRSDTMIVVHFAPGNAKATMVSFPRDSWVTIPAHVQNGKQVAAKQDRLNTAFEAGGPALLIDTLQALTGQHIDHYIQVDFAGFQPIVDGLGGVDVCLTKAAKDSFSGLNLKAGPHHIDGATALAFVRQRHGLPGGDLDRIHRQQQFFASVVRQTVSAGTLTNPVKLTGVLNAVTSSVSVDEHLSVNDMKNFALKLRNLDSSHVVFATAPVLKPQKINGMDVLILDSAQMSSLFSTLHQEDTAPAPTTGASNPPATSAVTIPPGQVKVQVLNGAGIAGLARKAADDLAALGFGTAGEPRNAATSGAKGSEVRYPKALAAQARTVAAAVPGATLVESEGVSLVTLTVGSSYNGATKVTVAQPSAAGTTSPSAPATKTATEVTCTA